MGVHLFSVESDKSIAMSWLGWSTILITARTYGWEPAGTVCPSIAGWGGSYHSNDGQMVTVADAANLAEALQAALLELEGHCAWYRVLAAEQPKVLDEDQPWHVAVAALESEELALQNADVLAQVLGAMMGSGPDRAFRRNFLIRNASFVEKFIAFAGQSAFEIY